MQAIAAKVQLYMVSHVQEGKPRAVYMRAPALMEVLRAAGPAPAATAGQSASSGPAACRSINMTCLQVTFSPRAQRLVATCHVTCLCVAEAAMRV